MLTQKLKEMDLQPKINTLDKQALDNESLHPVQEDTPHVQVAEVISEPTSESSDSEVENLQANFFEVNKVKYEKRRLDHHYYQRPTLVDILFEANDNFISNIYNPKTIYEWNLDSLTNGVIHNLLHRMLMYSTVFKQINNIEKNMYYDYLWIHRYLKEVVR